MGARRGTLEGDRRDVLMTLVDQYERSRWPDVDLDPVEAIKARMENSGRTRKDFVKIAGSSGRASEILNRKTPLTLAMIWKLVHQWKMPAEVLVRPYALPMETSERPVGNGRHDLTTRHKSTRRERRRF